MDICFSKEKDPYQPNPEVVKLVEKLTENIAFISGISTAACNSKHDIQKSRFWELCQSVIGTKNYVHLRTILLFFVQQLKEHSITCYHKPNRASKLMKFMNQALVLFHLEFQEMKEAITPYHCSSYYSTITDLIALYLDMELHASRRRKEHLEKISGRLTSFLIILLDNSQEHILDTLLKSRFSKRFHEICNAVLKKFLTLEISNSIDVNMYIRYILAYKLWKKIMKTIDEKKEITKIAVSKLFWPPSLQRSANVFGSVLPEIPKCKKDPTLFFIQAKFKIKTAYEAFQKSNNSEELEKENKIILEASNNYLKSEKKNVIPFSKKHKVCNGKLSLKCNYKKKLKKKNCREVHKHKKLLVTNKANVSEDVNIADSASSSINETKSSEEFSLENSIIGKEDESTGTFPVLSNTPNVMQETKKDVNLSMEFDITQANLKFNSVKDNNSDESQSKQMGMLTTGDSMSNKLSMVQWKENDEPQSIHADIVSVTDSLRFGPNQDHREETDVTCINTCASDSFQLKEYFYNLENAYQSNKHNQVQREESCERQNINLGIAVMTDLLLKKCNEVQIDKGDKPQNIHAATWANSVYNEPHHMQHKSNDEHQSVEMDIAKKCYSSPNDLNHSSELNILGSKQSFNFTFTAPVENVQFDHKSANECNSVDSLDFKMIIPKKETNLVNNCIEETNCERKLITNLVPFLQKCDIKDVNLNCGVKEEFLDSKNVTMKQEIEGDIEMDVDPENKMTCNGKVISQPVDSNENYVSQTSSKQSFSQISPLQLTKINSDSSIIESRDQLKERTNVELTLDFVSSGNIEQTNSDDNINRSSLNQLKNYIIDDCEEIGSSINNNNIEENDMVTFEMKQTIEHCQNITGAHENSLIIGKSLDVYKNKSKNAESLIENKILVSQKDNCVKENTDYKVIVPNEKNSDLTESEYGELGAHQESSESNNKSCINNKPTDENTTIYIIQGEIYSNLNQGSPSGTHFVTVGEYGSIKEPVEGQCDKIVVNDGICPKKVNLNLNKDEFSKSNCYSNFEIDHQNEENASALDTSVRNLESKCPIEMSTLKDYPIQIISGKLTNLQENGETESESCTTLGIPEALLLETCGIGETVSTEIVDSSNNTIAFISSPMSIKMIIPGSINTQNVNNSTSGSIQPSGSVDSLGNEYQQCENGQGREHTSHLTESQILSLKEFLIIKEKDLDGNFHKLSCSENCITEERELQKSDSVENSSSTEFKDCCSGVEHSDYLDGSIKVPSVANDSEIDNSRCKTVMPNKCTRELVINCDNTPVFSNVSEPDNSPKRLKDIKNQKSVHELPCVAKLCYSCTMDLENINRADEQLLKSDTAEHHNINISQVDVAIDSLKGSKPSKSESIFENVASNGFTGDRLSRDADAIEAKVQPIQVSDNEFSIVNMNNTICTPELTYCRLECPKTLSGLQDQNLTENVQSGMNIINNTTANYKQTQHTNRNISENKVGTCDPVVTKVYNKKTFLKSNSIACSPESDLTNENESQTVVVKEHSERKDMVLPPQNISKSPDNSRNSSVLVSKKVRLIDKNSKTKNSCNIANISNPSVKNIFEDVSPDVKNKIADRKTSKTEYIVNNSYETVLVGNAISFTDKDSSETDNRLGSANPSAKNILEPVSSVFRDIDRLIDKSSTEKEESKHTPEDSNLPTKDLSDHVSSDVTGVLKNDSFFKNSNNEQNVVSNEMKLTDKNGPINENSWYSTQNSNQSTKHIFEDISPDASGSLSKSVIKRFQHFSQKTTEVTNKSNVETKRLLGQIDIPQTEVVNCSVSKVSSFQVDNESYTNNIQRVDKDTSRKCNKRKDTEELHSSSAKVQPVNFYLTPIMNGFSYSVGSEIKYTPLLQPPQAPEELTANVQLICKCASCYAHYLKQSEKSQSQDSAKHPFIPDRNYIYIDGELVENEVLTVMKRLEWFLMNVMNNRKEPEDLEYKYKQDSESPNLPIKKRLTLAHITSRDENKIVEEECFPSYSKKRMMSIAELEVTQNPSYCRPVPFELYDSHLNPNGPIVDHATSWNPPLQQKFTNYNSTVVFNNSPYDYMSLDTRQQYFPHNDQQCSMDSEVVDSKYGHSKDTEKRYCLDRALEDVNKTIKYSRAKSSSNYEFRNKYYNFFQER